MKLTWKRRLGSVYTLHWTFGSVTDLAISLDSRPLAVV